MKLTPSQLGISLSTFCFITATQAGVPLWSFTPNANFPPTAYVTPTNTAVVQYIVTNNSPKAHNLVIKPRQGLSQNGPCLVGPKGSANSTCTLTLTITGSELSASGLSGGPVLCQANANGTPNPNQCYQPNPADRLAINLVTGTTFLSASVANLALSINHPSLNAALTGTPRIITITNFGNVRAIDLAVNYPALPGGSPATTASDNCGTSLAAGSSCTITVIPGATATSGAGNVACTTGIAPTPGVISVTASNANTTATNVVVLGYGCIYQGGYIYSVDDTTANTGSISGNVLAQTDSSTTSGIVWDSNSACLAAPTTGCYTTNADSMSNGTNFATPPPGGNTFIISQVLTTEHGEIPSTYAAGLCATTVMDGYNDWYLPAICEMGFTVTFGGLNCGGADAPMRQNIQSNLINNNIFAGLPTGGSTAFPGHYWASTEFNEISAITACDTEYLSNGTVLQFADGLKNVLFGVRCARVLTP
jgi:hypothetical protein